MPNIIKMVLFMLAGAVAMLIAAAVYFGAVFTVIDAIDGTTGGSEPAAFGYRLSHLASIAGLCVGVGLALAAAHERLRRNGKPDRVALTVGWVLAIPVFALFLYAGTAEAFDLLADHGSLGFFSLVPYVSFVGWLGNKLAKPAAG